MCVAVLVPAGQRLTEQQLRAMHRANPDSWGFGFFNTYSPTNTSKNLPPGYLTTNKGVSDTDAMLKAYEEQMKNDNPGRKTSAHLAHFRIRTQGKTDNANAHPFYIDGGLLIHNGHINGANGPAGPDLFSDTYYFSKVFKSHLPANLTEEQKESLSKIIGSYNKLVMLHNDGSHTIINEKAGTRLENGVWVSNTYWQGRYNFADL